MTDKSIENLLSLFEDISIESELVPLNNDKIKEENMTATTDYQLLKLFLETIPSYDGNPHTLSVFINSAENLIITYPTINNPVLQNVILRALIGKLTGRALMLIGSRTDLKTWDEIKTILCQSFGDQRDIDCLIQDLLILKPTKNETPYSFGTRCQDARCLIISKVNTLNIEAAEKIVRIKSYNDLALKTFVRGIPNPIQTTIRLRNPENLEQAMGFVIEEENFLYASRQANNLNQYIFNPVQNTLINSPHNQPSRILPTNMSRPVNQIKPQINNYKPGQNPFKSPQNPFQTPKPNQPIVQRPNYQNYLQRPPPHKYPNFGQQQQFNTHRYPNGNVTVNNPNTSYKPTPMSISTHQSIPQSQFNKAGYSQVHHLETDEETINDPHVLHSNQFDPEDLDETTENVEESPNDFLGEMASE